MSRKRFPYYVCVLAAAGLLCSGCQAAQSELTAPPVQTAVPVQATAVPTTASAVRQSAVGFYFDTVVTVTTYGADATLLEDMWAMCARYESMLSKTIAGSDVDKINTAEGQPVTVDPETWELIRDAKEISDATEHAFSISIAPLTAMWDFTGGTERMPTEAERLAALPLVNDDAILLGDNNTVTMPAGMQIDLGGIAKGYIADRIADLARGRCMGMVLSLGGNTYVVGSKPDGSRWGIGIQDPDGNTGSSLAVLNIDDGTVVTSGIYERYFIKDGVRFHHILDPKTGISADSDLASATITGVSSMRADALATACIVLGSEKSLAMLESMGVDGLFITRDGQMLETPGFTETYNLRKLK